MMAARILIAVVLLAAGLASAAEPERALSERAHEALAQKATDQAAHGNYLAGYADSLRTIDVALAARCLEVAGIAAFRSNQLDSALVRWRRGVDWARAGKLLKSESSLLNALAIGYTVRGEVEQALPVYDRTLEIRESLADTLGLSRTWGNLAQAYVNIGRTAEALSATLTEEMWLSRVDNPRGQVANAIRRAQILTSMGRYEEARLSGERAVSLADKHGDENARGLAAMCYGNALLDLGRLDEALDVLKTSHDLLTADGDDYSAAFVEQSLVECLLRLERYEEALERVRSLAPQVAAAGHRPLLIVLRRLEGNALFALGRRAEAETVLGEALALFEDRREDLDDELSRAGIFKASGETYASLARCQMADGRTADALATVERGRAPAFRDREGSDVPGLAELQTALRSREAALILFNDPAWDPLVAFVLDGESLTAVELGTVAPIAADARAALRLLAAGESLATCGPALARLATAISVPVLAVVSPEVKRFLVVPPSFLAGFPLGILGDGQGRRWSEERPLSYLPNATALLDLGERTAAQQGVLAMADPAVPADLMVDRLPVSPARAEAGVPLPEARAEIEVVASRAGDRRVGAAASGEALRAALTSSLAVLHLATHAVVDPIDGGRSAVVLAGADGIDAVTALEISGADFQGDLVVLSGCNTFGRQRILGEGWFGLPRSFLNAGARTVVSTLWDVDDRGARQFVTAFYGALRAGAARDLALLQAREVCRAAGMPPREWAAFVLSGVADEAVPLLVDGGEASGRLPIMVGLAALLLIVVVVRQRR